MTIDTSLKTFLGNYGEPLPNGYVYIGEPNQDPRNFPKTVTFEDSSGNQFDAAQPLRLNQDSRISYNGKAITATVDGDFSMLILDAGQVQINEGYIRKIEQDSAEDVNLEGFRRYYPTLNDVLQLSPSPGDIVGNVGRITNSDGEGQDWVAVNSTGLPADDLEIIDFANSLQGIRWQKDSNVSDFVKSNTTYVKESVTLDSDVFDVTSLSSSVFHTIGPTASGADAQWSALNSLPENAKWVEISAKVFTAAFVTTPGSEEFTLWGYFWAFDADEGQLGTASPNLQIGGYKETADQTGVKGTASIKIPLDDNNRFKLYWSSQNVFLVGASTFEISVTAFGV